MPTEFRAAANVVRHDNYTATTTPTTKTPIDQANFLLIENLDATNSILISFDGGVTFKTLAPGKFLGMEVSQLLSYVVRSSAGTASVECLYGSEA